MSNPTHLRRAATRAASVIAFGLAAVVVPTAAHARRRSTLPPRTRSSCSAARPSPTPVQVFSTAISGSPRDGAARLRPATINGATHANDAVAAQAQLDLTTAYNVAAGQTPATDSRDRISATSTSTAGAYAYTSDAQLTGPLTLNAGGDPNAQFVFMIASTLTTASSSSVVLTGLASPCNVFWQVGSSATLGTTTAFQGNVLALTSITLERSHGPGPCARPQRRGHAGHQRPHRGMCGTDPAAAGPTPTPPRRLGAGGQAPPASTTGTRRHGRLDAHPASPAVGPACAAGFSATLRGRQIKSVVFRLDGRRIASLTKSPFRVCVTAGAGNHRVTARVTFKDATRAKTLRLPYRVCAAAALRPRQGPSQFTG